MKSLKISKQILIAVIVLAATEQMYAQGSGQQSQGSSPLIMTATGTGETTGHIMDVTLKNSTDQRIKVDVGPYFIPSSGQYQPYIVPNVVSLSVPPNGQMTIPVEGYCADIHTPPVPSGKPMVSYNDWVKPADLADNWQPSVTNGWKPVDESVITIPGKNIPMGHVIDINKYPAEAAPLLLDAIGRISRNYDSLQSTGKISTPFSGNPEKERESVIQQTFWIYSSALTGSKYKVEDFANKTVQQYEENSGKKFSTLPDNEKDQLVGGIADFWNTFEAVGAEAKVLLAANPDDVEFGAIAGAKDWIDYDKVKKADDFDKIRRTKYDKYVVEREINKKTHEEACEEIDIDPDSAFAKACKRVYGK
jgi:hypothetical protein